MLRLPARPRALDQLSEADGRIAVNVFGHETHQVADAPLRPCVPRTTKSICSWIGFDKSPQFAFSSEVHADVAHRPPARTWFLDLPAPEQARACQASVEESVRERRQGNNVHGEDLDPTSGRSRAQKAKRRPSTAKIGRVENVFQGNVRASNHFSEAFLPTQAFLQTRVPSFGDFFS